MIMRKMLLIDNIILWDMRFQMRHSSQAIIFDTQRFSLHDGPGIRTTVFFKGCPLRCAWCQNPESQKSNPEIGFYTEKCLHCFQCLPICPEGAILNHDSRRVDYCRCSHCGKCAGVCPGGALLLIGKSYTAETLARELVKDCDFFQESGGGITLSGGEPMMHGVFLESLLPILKESKLHINLETCGVFQWDELQPILSLLDLIYFDLKLMDPKMHRKHTRGDNQLIQKNFIRLSAAFQNLQARMPIIPGITDTADNIIATAQFLKQSGHQSIHCLPYHCLGEEKLSRIEGEITPLYMGNLSVETCQRTAALFKKEGIHAVVYE